MSKYTADLRGPTPYSPRWHLIPTNAVWVQPFWSFPHRHLAVQFAARKGIRIERES